MSINWKTCEDLVTVFGLDPSYDKLECPNITPIFEKESDTRFFSLPDEFPCVYHLDHERKERYDVKEGNVCLCGGGLYFHNTYIQYDSIVDFTIYEYTLDSETSRKTYLKRDAALGLLIAGPTGAIVGANLSFLHGNIKAYYAVVNFWNLETRKIETCVAMFGQKDKSYLIEYSKSFELHSQRYKDNGFKIPKEEKGCLFFLTLILTGISVLSYGGYTLMSCVS